MKAFKLCTIFVSALAANLISSCKNQDIEFDNFDYSAVYFAYQTPVRTLVMGEDTYDTSLDNEHKCQIYATMGGVYSNTKKIVIDIEVDDKLCDNLYFEDGSKVEPMPKDYYSLSADKIILNKELMGAVDVQFTDKFFEDQNTLKNTFVIPVKITGTPSNVDSVLVGKPAIEGKEDLSRTNPADWAVQPKDYVLYCVKYINKWHANYLRRGKDVITVGGNESTIVRHNEYVEKDESCKVTTRNLKTAVFPVTIKASDSQTLKCDLLLNFDDKDECTISTETSGYQVTGKGKFVSKGDKNSWAGKDRDVLYLEYEINNSGVKAVTNDTLVVRDRGVKIETFTPKYTVKAGN